MANKVMVIDDNGVARVVRRQYAIDRGIARQVREVPKRELQTPHQPRRLWWLPWWLQ